MPEEELHRFLELLNRDAGFRDRLHRDLAGTLAEFDLSHTEQVALASNDEDALRRLAGAHVDIGPVGPGSAERNWLSRLLCTSFFCGPPRTSDWQCPRLP